jgi:hypothetical protein
MKDSTRDELGCMAGLAGLFVLTVFCGFLIGALAKATIPDALDHAGHAIVVSQK